MSTTAKLGLTDFDRLTPGTTPFNRLAEILDGLIHVTVIETADEPAALTLAPSTGKVYRVAATGIGNWAGEDNNLAIAKEEIDPTNFTTWVAANWEFITPVEGFIIWLETLSGHRLTFNDSGWMTPATVADLNVGVTNQADTEARIIELLELLRAHGVIAT